MKQKMFEMQAVSDPNADDGSRLSQNSKDTSQSPANVDGKENHDFRPMSIQISVHQGSVSPREKATQNLSARITDSEGNLVFNRTESEQEYEQKFSFLLLCLLIQII